jgi:bacterioferritin (cytochrome b1)
MEKARKIDLLNRVLHGTVNSVLQYIETATPYVAPGCEEQFDEVLGMKDEQVATVARLTDAIGALDGVPKVGVFPYWNVDLNYLDLRYLARLASEHEDAGAAELEGELGLVRDDPKLHGVLEKVLAEKRAHAEKLAAIGGAAAPEAAPSEAEETTPAE